jgi:hypothetical protein
LRRTRITLDLHEKTLKIALSKAQSYPLRIASMRNSDICDIW